MNLPLTVIQKATYRNMYGFVFTHKGFPAGAVVRNPPASAGDTGVQVQSWVGKILWRREWQPIPVFLPGKSHGKRRAWWTIVQGVTKSRTQLSD